MTDREKLEKIKALADKMYSRMAYLTSDTRPIRQAMDEYHQFIINEYHKEEPVSEELEKAALNNFNRVLESLGYKPSDIRGQDYTDIVKLSTRSFENGAKWQKQWLMTKAINAQCFGFQDDALFSFRLPADNYLAGSNVKVIVIKED